MQATGRIIIGVFAFITAVSTAFSDNLTISSFSSYAGQTNILLQASGNITFTGGSLSLPDLPSAGQLVVQAGNNITVEDGSGIIAGTNWTVSMVAGTAFSGTTPSPGNDGIYLNGSAYLQAQNGDISLLATNEIVVGTGAIRTLAGGNIDVTTEYGNVNSGMSTVGYDYLTTAPYYTPDSNLGGIGTAAGGNVTINAGGDVISFPATTVAAGDPGSGAFGPEPGNVTINVGGNIYGHYVVMNGTGTINADQNIGTSPQNVALSLAKGSWSLGTPGNIYLQEARNPNGVFDNLTTIQNRRAVPTAGNHLFDYDPQASVALTAGNAVYLTGFDLPRPNGAVPLLLPPIVTINAGPGGVAMETPTATDGVTVNDVSLSDYDLTLFPSPYGNLQIMTTAGGGLSSGNAGGTAATLLMSDSAQAHWFVTNSGPQPFSSTDHGSVPPELNNPNPAIVSLSGSMENVILLASKQTQIAVAGDMSGCSFYGKNLHAGDVTSITVGGQIYNASSFNSVVLDQPPPTVPSADLPPLAPPGSLLSSWYLALALAVNPALLPTQSLSGYSPSQLLNILSGAAAFTGLNFSTMAYNPDSKALTSIGQMSSGLLAVMQSPTLTLARYDTNGYPLLDSNGHFVLDTISWTPANSANYSEINTLYTESQEAPALGVANGAYFVGGTGQFDVSANTISLGNAYGILSLGNGKLLGADYSYLTPYITSGATINVTVAGDLDMPGSAIAALGGGDVNVTSTNGAINLGSPDLAAFEDQIMNATQLGLGIYTSGSGDVNVRALGTINVDSSRIATFDGGNIFIESYTGSVNAGSGSSTFVVPVNVFSPAAVVGEPYEYVYANGIVAQTLVNPSQIPGSATVPGNITVLTPQGSIFASQGGILQDVLNGSLPSGPTITLTAGTFGPPVYIGNIFLGYFGVIGERSWPKPRAPSPDLPLALIPRLHKPTTL